MGLALHRPTSAPLDARRRAERRAQRTALAQRTGLRLLSLAVFLIAWWIVAETNVWDDLFVPDPDQVWARFKESVTVHDGVEGLSGYYLWEHLFASLERILVVRHAGITVAPTSTPV